jgi:thiamine phosphate synthase YjbQ (UPF0047 family)
MTSVEIPYSIACALPSLTVVDITNDVAHELERAGSASGIAFVTPTEDHYLVRVSERETGLFSDLEEMLTRLVPLEIGERERLLELLLGPRTEQIPFQGGKLCLGRWQRVLLFGLNGATRAGWTLTVVG